MSSAGGATRLAGLYHFRKGLPGFGVHNAGNGTMPGSDRRLAAWGPAPAALARRPGPDPP